MSQQQSDLIYNRTTRRWEGQDTTHGFSIWMDDPTFQRYVWRHLDSQQTYQPTLGDLEKARIRCRQLSYWRECRDPEIHFVSLHESD